MGSLTSCKIRRGVNLVYSPSSLLTGEATAQKIQSTDGSLTNGTGTGKADLVYDAVLSETASSNTNRDLIASLLDKYGSTLSFVKVKFLRIEADSGNTNDVQFKPGASNGWITGPLRTAAHTIHLGPGEAFQWESLGAGKAPVASTGDIVNFANSSSGTSVSYRLIIIGASA